MIDDGLLHTIRDRAGERNHAGAWPADELDALTAAGARRWPISREFGGLGRSPVEVFEGYEQIARYSLAVAFVLTQDEGCAGYFAASDNPKVRDRLRQFARGTRFGTVGISHLTTSRAGGVTAVPNGAGGYILNGLVPWSTGAGEADDVLIGATLDDDPKQQVLCVVRPREQSGVTVRPPPQIVGLSASRTTAVELIDVQIEGDCVVAGPASGVLSKRVGRLPINQAFLALGHARGAIDLIEDAGEAAAATFAGEHADLRRRVLSHATAGSPDAAEGDLLRAGAITFSQHACLAAVAAHKGAALVDHHPAQRLAREALFLLVWSCPGPVRDCTLRRLAAGSH